MNKKIILTKVSEGVHSSIKNRPEICGFGQNVDEAIGSLVRSYREVIGVDIGWDMEDIQTKMFLNDPENAWRAY